MCVCGGGGGSGTGLTFRFQQRPVWTLPPLTQARVEARVGLVCLGIYFLPTFLHWDMRSEVCRCTYCVSMCVSVPCLPSIDGVHQTTAEGVCLASTLVWFIQSAGLAGAPYLIRCQLPATLLEAVSIMCVWSIRRPRVEGKHWLTQTPNMHFCSFISSFAGICGSVSGRSTGCQSQYQSNNKHLLQYFPKPPFWLMIEQ